MWWVRIFVAGEDSVVGEEGCCRSVEELGPRTTVQQGTECNFITIG